MLNAIALRERTSSTRFSPCIDWDDERVLQPQHDWLAPILGYPQAFPQYEDAVVRGRDLVAKLLKGSLCYQNNEPLAVDSGTRIAGENLCDFMKAGIYLRIVPIGARTSFPQIYGVAAQEENASALASLKSYEALSQPNWDGYGAEPISSDTLTYARSFIRALPTSLGKPEVSPSADGAIALEWMPSAGPVHKLFLDIGPGKQWFAYWKMRDGTFDRFPGTGDVTSETKRTLKELFENLSK